MNVEKRSVRVAIVYQVFSLADATLRAHITKNPQLADVWISRATNRGTSIRPLCWFFTDNRAEASIRIYLCSKGLSQISIFFVSDATQAKWISKASEHRRLIR